MHGQAVVHQDLLARARPWSGLVALGCLMAWGQAGAAQSSAPQAPSEGHPPVATPPAMSLDRAVAVAEQHFKARVVRATEDDVDGHRVYVLRLLSDEGRVWTVRVDAQTGVMN